MTFTPEIKLEHADKRGEIYSITLPDDKELILLHSVPGALRGGHSHDVEETVMLLTGKMKYHKRVTRGPDNAIMEPGHISFNRPGDVHMGEFLEDSWLVEFKVARKGEWKNNDDSTYRAQVQANAV